MTTDVVGGHAVDRGLDLLPIRIVVEVGRRRAGDGDEAVLRFIVRIKIRVSLEVTISSDVREKFYTK